MIMGIAWVCQYRDHETTLSFMDGSDLELTASLRLTATTMQPCSRALSDQSMDPDLVPRLELHNVGQKSDPAICLAPYE